MLFTEVEKTRRGANLEKEINEFSFGLTRFKLYMRNPRNNVKKRVDYATLHLREVV